MSSLRNQVVLAIGEIIPLDQQTCEEMVNYGLTLPDSQVDSHFLDLLGASDATFAFIAKFYELKNGTAKKPESPKPKSDSPIPKPHTQSHIPSQNPVHQSKGPKQKQPSNAWVAPPPQKKNERPEGKSRVAGRASTTTSELMDIKPSNQLSSNQAKRAKKKNLTSLKDIEAALNDLEVSKASESTGRRKCSCMATRHPLFELAPNCLNCGKIICSKEGLQPCSFCGQELLSAMDKFEISSVLRQERQDLEYKQDNIKNRKVQELKPKKIVVSMRAGENMWKAQERALKEAEEEKRKANDALVQHNLEQKELQQQEKELEHYKRTQNVNPDLLKAQERLDTLLNFQETGAERTKIIDRASDFEMPSSNSASTWLSPMERALLLKKQQRTLRKYEDTEKERTGRGKKTVEMVIKNGKVHMVEKYLPSENESDKEIEQMEQQIREEKKDQDEELVKNTWDYQKDKNKWEKPVYVLKNTTESAGETFKNRVQFAAPEDESELVASI